MWCLCWIRSYLKVGLDFSSHMAAFNAARSLYPVANPPKTNTYWQTLHTLPEGDNNKPFIHGHVGIELQRWYGAHSSGFNSLLACEHVEQMRITIMPKLIMNAKSTFTLSQSSTARDVVTLGAAAGLVLITHRA